MASTNQSPFYQRAEQEFQEATTDQERIACLEIMIKECPKHKSSENMLRNLKIRLKKLKDGVEKQKKSGKGNQKGIKKADMQTVLCGLPNTGKSTLFNKLTNLNAKTAQSPFTTHENQLGSFDYQDVKIQLIDTAPFPNHDKGLINGTDTLLLVVDNLEKLKESLENLYRTRAKIIIIYNKSDNLNEKNKRKIKETLKSKYKKFDFFFTSKDLSKIELEKLKEKIFKTFPIIRIYTKEPKKDPTKTPMILKKESSLEDAAEKILKGMSKSIKRARVWGPSSKFAGQVVGLEHPLKDKDIIEFQTK